MTKTEIQVEIAKGIIEKIKIDGVSKFVKTPSEDGRYSDEDVLQVLETTFAAFIMANNLGEILFNA